MQHQDPILRFLRDPKWIDTHLAGRLQRHGRSGLHKQISGLQLCIEGLFSVAIDRECACYTCHAPSLNTPECLSVTSRGYCYCFLCFDWLIDPWIGSISL